MREDGQVGYGPRNFALLHCHAVNISIRLTNQILTVHLRASSLDSMTSKGAANEEYIFCNNDCIYVFY